MEWTYAYSARYVNKHIPRGLYAKQVCHQHTYIACADSCSVDMHEIQLGPHTSVLSSQLCIPHFRRVHECIRLAHACIIFAGCFCTECILYVHVRTQGYASIYILMSYAGVYVCGYCMLPGCVHADVCRCMYQSRRIPCYISYITMQS